MCTCSTPVKVACSEFRSHTTSRPGLARRAHTHTYGGQFVKLVPNKQVVEVMEFETANPAMHGEMTVTFTLTDSEGGTDVLGVHDNLPPGVSPSYNETGWRMALDKLAAFVEAGQGT